MSYEGSEAIIGRGAIFSIGPVAGTGSPTYTAIGEVTDINPSGRKWDTEEVTNFESAVDKEYIKAMRNPGPFSVKFNRVDDDAGQEALETAFDSTSAYIFKLQFPAAAGFSAGEIWVFNALVLAHDPDELTPAKVIMGSLEMQRTGALAITPAVAS